MAKTKDYRYWFYEQEHESATQFFDLVEGIVRDTRTRVNLLILNSQKNIIDEFENWVPPNFNIKITKRGIKYVLELEKIGSEAIKIIVIKYPQVKNVYFAISDCRSTDFKNIFAKFVTKYFPVVSKIFLTNNEMYLIFKRLEKVGFNSIVESSYAKKREPGAERPDSFIHYTNMPYKKVFDDMFVNDRWVQGIRYRAIISDPINKRKRIAFKGTITRDCYYSVKFDFRQLIKTIIPYSLELASARNEHLKLSVESAKDLKPQPVIINFDESIFDDVTKNKSYVNALAELPSCSISEYHTNPYIHISLVDYLDGSSYDMWVLSNDRMAIIPQLSASSASMSRLVNHIFERIHEGRVEKYEEIKSNSTS